ncbi:unnamed protein product [Camellia sinensis]
MEELSSLLYSEAIHVESKVTSSDLTVAYAAFKGSSPRLSSSSPRGSFASTQRGRGSSYRSESRFYKPGRGSFRGRSPNRGRASSGSSCQICGKSGHSAFDCWHRLDPGYPPPDFSASQSQGHDFSSSASQLPGPSSRAFVSTSEHGHGSSSQSPISPWFLDSAATDNITNDLNNLSVYHPYSGSEHVTMGNGSSIPIHHTGKGILPIPPFSFKLNSLLHVPSISSNLVSVHHFTKDNHCTITFDHDVFIVQDKHTKAILHRGFHVNGLYQFAFPPALSSPHALLSTTSSVSASIWHHRLGHTSSLKFQHLHPHVPVTKSLTHCISCSVSKSLRLPFQLSSSTVNKPLSLIHSDVWGPFTPSVSGFRFYVLFIDEYSKFT